VISRLWAERGWRNAALAGVLIGGGDPQKDVLPARLGRNTNEKGNPGSGMVVGVADGTGT
jgi:hypothetical protein